ncbi:hypothetical protein PMIN03_012898 [Paraphaeosphaeria minitans]
MARYTYDDELWDSARIVVQYSYPVFFLVFFLVACTVRSIAASNSNVTKPTTTGPGGKPLPTTDPTRNFVKKATHNDVTHSQKLLFTWLSLFAAATFVGNAAVSVTHALVDQTDTWWAGNHVVVYLIGSFFVYCLFLISLIDSKPSPTSVHPATWIVAALLEVVLVGLSLAIYTHAHHQPLLDPEKDYISWGVTRWEAGEVAWDFLAHRRTRRVDWLLRGFRVTRAAEIFSRVRQRE